MEIKITKSPVASRKLHSKIAGMKEKEKKKKRKKEKREPSTWARGRQGSGVVSSPERMINLSASLPKALGSFDFGHPTFTEMAEPALFGQGSVGISHSGRSLGCDARDMSSAKPLLFPV